jgi:hypothetical protein
MHDQMSMATRLLAAGFRVNSAIDGICSAGYYGFAVLLREQRIKPLVDGAD